MTTSLGEGKLWIQNYLCLKMYPVLHPTHGGQGISTVMKNGTTGEDEISDSELRSILE